MAWLRRLILTGERAYLALLLLLSFLAYLPNFFILYLGGDESGRHVMCRETFTGGLYTELSSHRPPFDFEMNYLWSFGCKNFWADHYFFALWLFFGAFFLYQILKRFFSNHAARAACLLYVLLGGMINYGAGANERMYLPFILAAAYLCFQLQDHSRWSALFLRSGAIGALLMAATSIKQTAGIVGFVVVILFLCARSWRFFPLALCGLAACGGGLIFVAVSWAAIDVPWQTIWQEGYASNVSYIYAVKMKNDGLKNSLYIFGVQYLAIFIPAMLGFFWWLKNSPLKRPLKPSVFLILIWILLTIFSIVIGQRFLQQYYINALPLLAFGAAYWFHSRRGFEAFILLAFVTMLGFQGFTFYRQAADRNHYWDSEMKRLAHEIKKDTQESDYIWLSQSAFPAYVVSGRRPAIRYLWFHSMMGQVDICHAPDEVLREHLEDPSYQIALQDLYKKRPQIIFWTTRKANGCADRLHQENFPSLKAYIDQYFVKKWESPLGIYYQRRAAL